MVRAEGQRDLDVDQRIAGEHAALGGFLRALLDGGDVFLRNRTARKLVLELEAGAGGQRLDLEPHVSILAGTTRLLDVLAFRFGAGADRLLVGNHRTALVGVHTELATDLL